MNAGKRGAPFSYPDQFVAFMGFIYSIFHIPYRQMEGFLRKLSGLVSRDITADYTTLFKRISKMNFDLPETISEEEDDIVIAVDLSGVKVTNSGEWMREKWRVYRGGIKVHIAVDISTKETLAIEVTDETVTDSEKFDTYLSGLHIRVSSFLSPSWILMEIPFAFVDEFFLVFDYCLDLLFIKKVEVILTIISSISIQCIYIISIDTLLSLSHQYFKHLPIIGSRILQSQP
ncbi:Transposase DDE domain protein [Candidatus Methanoperedenaceae archaeon GB37]|nr:Transposase DDE domain protein [Candidatus Methanoperedenaceae archaeon GB37]